MRSKRDLRMASFPFSFLQIRSTIPTVILDRHFDSVTLLVVSKNKHGDFSKTSNI